MQIARAASSSPIAPNAHIVAAVAALRTSVTAANALAAQSRAIVIDATQGDWRDTVRGAYALAFQGDDQLVSGLATAKAAVALLDQRSDLGLEATAFVSAGTSALKRSADVTAKALADVTAHPTDSNLLQSRDAFALDTATDADFVNQIATALANLQS
jgi:hypothetical protein